MEDQIISFETAKLAKDKGFKINGLSPLTCDVTQSLLQKWLREIHSIHIYIDPANNTNYGVLVGKYNDDNLEGDWIRNKQEDPIYFKTYEEALEAGLLQALKLI